MAGLVLLSGGLDSLVAAAHAVRHGGLDLALTFDYGQRAAAKESEAAALAAGDLGMEHQVIALPFMKGLGSNALTGQQQPLPQPDPDQLDRMETARESAKAVWVPNRNGLFIQIGASLAQARGLDRVVVGFNEEEAATFPDNGVEFLEAVNRTLSFTLDRPVRVEAPTALLRKTEIVRLGLDLDAPLARIWSCYQEGPRHCLRCESCLRLKRAFQGERVWERFAPLL